MFALVAPLYLFARVPFPIRRTFGELLALLWMVSVPVRLPNAVGEKRSVTTQLDLGPIVAPQPFTIVKSPLTPMLETVTAVVLLLFWTVSLCGLLWARSPKTTLPKLILPDETFNLTGTGVAVGVAVGVRVAVAVAVAVAVCVAVGVAVFVAVAVAVDVAVAVSVAVAVGVTVAVAVAVSVAVAVAVLVAVAV
jgi:hypothetical protein